VFPGKLTPVVPGRIALVPASRRAILLAGGGIVLAGLAAYHNSFPAPFVFDDRASILDNPTIRHLWPVWEALSPPHGAGVTVAGRPILNLSFAINYAISGLDGWSYHLLNLVIHILAGLTLFGIVRRTLLRSVGAQAVGAQTCCALGDGRSKSAPLHADAIPIALTIALLWTLHPLQTESVTYLVQRAESLMGLFYLLTMYCYIRSVDAPRPGIWQGLAVTACLLGMGTKEVMVTAPLMVLLYDRTFVAGSFREAWRTRGRFYAVLGATWLWLAWLLVGTGGRGGTAGFVPNVTWWQYAFTQCGAVVHYLRLTVWPAPLLFDYGGAVLVRSLAEVWWQAIVVLALLGLTIWALVRKPRSGFLGAWFFAILAPTSSVVPLADTVFEHRIYLSLAAVVVAAVLALHAVAGRRGLMVGAALAVGLGWLSMRRNEDYRSELTLWSDTVAKRPENARAHTNLGIALAESGRIADAVAQYQEAIRIEPAIPAAQLNLCNALTRLGRPAEALPHGEAAVRMDPGNANAHVDLGLALVALGRAAEALPHYAEALRLQPQAADVPADLGVALVRLGRGAEAVAHFEAALRLDPTRAQTWCDLAGAYEQQGDRTAARRAVEHALGLQPDLPETLYVLGNLEAEGENFAAAIVRYRRALVLAPDYFPARNNLANALLITGQTDEAVAQYRQVLRQQPGDRSAQENLARALELQRSGRAHPSF
jgi:tetratricopeptide (TPR) repeat protein